MRVVQFFSKKADVLADVNKIII